MIEVCNLTLSAGNFRLEDICLKVETGAHAVLMGKTGSGKTTLLECMCGLHAAEKGSVKLNGREVSRLRPAERGIGFVPQDGALFPKLTVGENLAFALAVRNRPTAEIVARTEQLASDLGLAALLGRYPRHLSGGERQRVAIGRAIAFRPHTLLLDEPLSALDDETRGNLHDVLQLVKQDPLVTILHVTHSSADALTLADQIFELRDGSVFASEMGAPRTTLRPLEQRTAP